MSRSSAKAVYICGTTTTPGPREGCPDPLHDFPLPVDYLSASEEAERRLESGWDQKSCRVCRLVGWVQP